MTQSVLPDEEGTLDPGNSPDADAVAAYAGTKYIDETAIGLGVYEGVGIATLGTPADTFIGAPFPAVNRAGFGIDAKADVFGQGYAIWERETTPGSGIWLISHIETTAFVGGGSFFDPPGGGQRGRIAFQNRSVGAGTFSASLVWKTQAPGLFQFPIGAPISRTFPGGLVTASVQGLQPDNDFTIQRHPGSVHEYASTAVLGPGATFAPTIAPGSPSYSLFFGQVGPGYDATGFVSIIIQVTASHPSATNGILIEFSNDGFVTVNQQFTFTYTAADVGVGRRFSVPANLGEQFRITYTNGATLQTSFDLRTELAITAVQPMTDDIGRGTLLVTPGLRISQVFKRTEQIVAAENIAADTTVFVVPAGKRFYVVAYSWAGENASTAITGRVVVRDGPAGVAAIPIRIEEATGGLGGINTVANGSGAYPEQGFPFSTSVDIDIVTGTPTVDVTLIGYLEDE